jgi:hypothetical protein
MARTYSDETNGKLGVKGGDKIVGNAYNAKLKRIRATIQYDGQAAADDIVLGVLPVGAVFAYGMITASATAGASATIAIGKDGATGKYRTAATFTAANTPTPFGNAAAVDDAPLTSPETVIATIAVAALPASADFMIIDLYYSDLA